MPLSPEMIDAMMAAGLTREQMASVIKAAIVADAKADEDRRAAKRAGNAARQRKFKSARKTGNAGNALPKKRGPRPAVKTAHVTSKVTLITRVTRYRCYPLLDKRCPQTPKKIKPPKENPLRGQKKGLPLPEGWMPSTEDLAWAKAKGFTGREIEFGLERMRNWAAANAHREVGRKSKWGATWRNWMLQERTRAPPEQVDHRKRMQQWV